jgi:hypothetical protein
MFFTTYWAFDELTQNAKFKFFFRQTRTFRVHLNRTESQFRGRDLRTVKNYIFIQNLEPIKFSLTLKFGYNELGY